MEAVSASPKVQFWHLPETLKKNTKTGHFPRPEFDRFFVHTLEPPRHFIYSSVMNSKFYSFLVSGNFELKFFGFSDGVNMRSSLKAASVPHSVVFTIYSKAHYLLCSGHSTYNINYYHYLHFGLYP